MARFNSKYLHKTYRIALASMMAALSLMCVYRRTGAEFAGIHVLSVQHIRNASAA